MWRATPNNQATLSSQHTQSPTGHKKYILTGLPTGIIIQVYKIETTSPVSIRILNMASNNNEISTSDEEYQPMPRELAAQEEDISDYEEADGQRDDVDQYSENESNTEDEFEQEPELRTDPSGWTMVRWDRDVRGPLPPFTGHEAGPANPEHLYPTKADVFKAFIDEPMAQFLRDCMNTKAGGLIAATDNVKFNGATWYLASVDNIYVFIA